jgi:hypothetical protein
MWADNIPLDDVERPGRIQADEAGIEAAELQDGVAARRVGGGVLCRLKCGSSREVDSMRLLESRLIPI